MTDRSAYSSIALCEIKELVDAMRDAVKVFHEMRFLSELSDAHFYPSAIFDPYTERMQELVLQHEDQ